MFQKIAKHRANDASNDVHRPPLHLLAQIIWRSTLKYKHMQDSELFSDARIGRHLFGGIRSWSMLEEGGSIYHLVLADLNGCGQQLRSRTFLFGLFWVQAIIQTSKTLGKFCHIVFHFGTEMLTWPDCVFMFVSFCLSEESGFQLFETWSNKQENHNLLYPDNITNL